MKVEHCRCHEQTFYNRPWIYQNNSIYNLLIRYNQKCISYFDKQILQIIITIGENVLDVCKLILPLLFQEYKLRNIHVDFF